MTVLLGIVGSPAGGKSTAARILAEWGASWIDADAIARECLRRTDVIPELVDRFGEEIVDASGSVQRSALAKIVFGQDTESRAALADLEAIVHPRVRIVIGDQIQAAANARVHVALLDVPLLFESGWDQSCDAIWCVDASFDNRVRRAQSRGWDAAELERREANQLSIAMKCRLSNVVMRNDSTLSRLRENLRQHWDLLVKMRTSSADSTIRHCLSDWPTEH